MPAQLVRDLQAAREHVAAEPLAAPCVPSPSQFALLVREIRDLRAAMCPTPEALPTARRPAPAGTHPCAPPPTAIACLRAEIGRLRGLTRHTWLLLCE